MTRRSIGILARWRLAAACTALAMASTACGSTVQSSETVPALGPDNTTDNGLALPNPELGGTSAQLGVGNDDGVQPGESVATSALGGRKGPGAVPGTGPGTASEAPVGSPRNPENAPQSGRGFTADKIFIGYGTFDAVNEIGKSFAGSEAKGFGGQQRQANAAIEQINKEGGILGREVVPVFYDYEANEMANNPSASAQKACVHWTEDNPTFAVTTPIRHGADDQLAACLASRHTPFLPQSLLARPLSAFNRLAPYLLAPSWPALEDFAPVWVQRLRAASYFKGWNAELGRPESTKPVKVGLTTGPEYGEEFRNIVRAELARHSIEVAAEYQWSGDLSRQSDEMTLAVQRFRRQGVTHVMDNNINTFFMLAAKDQQYRPRLGTSTHAVPNQSGRLGTEDMYIGSRGIGWIPVMDTDTSHDPGPVSREQTRCTENLQDAGEDTSNRGALRLGLFACDTFNLIDGSVEKAGSPSPNALLVGARQLGTMPSASVFRMSFAHGRFGGASAVRDIEWRQNCDCYVYTSSKNHAM